MSTTFRSTCMAILLFACISWDGCFGMVFLCSDSTGFSHNRASVIAEIGQPASFTFCVDTDHHVHPSFKIEHTSMREDWFANSTKGRITTRMVKIGSKATITITINPVEENDFLDGFYVTVYRDPFNPNDNVLLCFQLKIKTGSKIFVCLDSACSSHNGTSVIAKIGQPASVTFCVDTDNEVHASYTIQHPSIRENWFSNSKRGRVTTRIVKDGTKATITITINPVEDRDLSDGFYVTVFRDPFNHSDSLQLFFQLGREKENLGSPGNSPDQSPSSEQTNVLPIVLPLVLALFIVFVVILLVVYRQKVKRYNETISVQLNTINSKENTNREIEQGRYENIKGQETSVKSMPAVTEEEDETKAYCVIQEY